MSAVGEAAALMLDFAERTGLGSSRPPQRYLWTDAFAVCNFLALRRATGEERYTELALRLVDQVHHVLGRHRGDEGRAGWISGLGEAEGELHPTRGGLRIGKKLPERPPGAPFDEPLEWDRDGQYFHYLTRWMHALDQVARATRDARFNAWARELAETAHRAFTVAPPGGGLRMVWKMSVDLSRPLVPSMGHHDPLDGLVVCAQLQATASRLPGAPAEPRLERALADFATLVKGREFATPDPLGLGGLLMDACRVAQLTREGAFAGSDLLAELLAAALAGLRYCAGQGLWKEPAAHRLAFRELGLAIGIAAVESLEGEVKRFRDPALRPWIQELRSYARLGSAIGSFWRDPEHRRNRTFQEHRDINEVMLATCLVPDGVLTLEALA